MCGSLLPSGGQDAAVQPHPRTAQITFLPTASPTFVLCPTGCCIWALYQGHTDGGRGPFFPFPHSRSPYLLPHSRSPYLLLHRSDPFLSDPSTQRLPGLMSRYFPVAGTLALMLVGLSCTATSSPHVSLPDFISAICLPVWSPRPPKALTSDKA